MGRPFRANPDCIKCHSLCDELYAVWWHYNEMMWWCCEKEKENCWLYESIEEAERYTDKIEDLEKKIDVLKRKNKMLLTNIKDVTDKLETSRTETLGAKHINEHEQTRIKDLENEIQRLKNDNEKATQELQHLQSYCKSHTIHVQPCKECDDLRITKDKDDYMNKEQANSIQQMLNETERLNTELQNLKAKYQTSEKAKDEAFTRLGEQQTATKEALIKNEKLNADLHKLSITCVDLEKAKEEALTRLSKEAGAKLLHGNAAITDLSDDNRPNKLAERFNEVYDNAWTDAFEELADAGLTEEKTIKVLYEILQNAYNYCSEREEWYRENIKLAVHTIPCAKDSTVDGGKITPFIQGDKLISDVRLRIGSSARNMMSENFLGELDKCMMSALQQFEKSKFPNTTEYSRQCASLCWLMRIRDPRVSINFKIQQGDPFDGAIFRQYRKTGKTAAYPVWPVLELYDEGPLLAKGVVQPE